MSPDSRTAALSLQRALSPLSFALLCAALDVVRGRLPARVIMTDYPQRNMPRPMGAVRQVSADRLVDPRTNQPCYLARIERPPERVREVAPVMTLKPGMPAEVMVMTGERTLLGYPAEPLLASVRKSFREN